MKDFTLTAYKRYVRAIKSSYPKILRFDDFFLADPKPEAFCLIRHDVDRKPKNAIQMAKLEKGMGIRATYYFRAKSHTFKPNIIREIASLGHEIGYHYECLSDTKGEMSLALRNFENNLRRFRETVPIKTISMHGRPLKSFDNRDMWRDPNNHSLLHKYGILGEVYLDIDYKNIAYINDSGRNWSSTKSNIRDKVDSSLEVNFETGDELHHWLKSNPHPQMVFQVHPERWANHMLAYYQRLCFDAMANTAKGIVKLTTNRK